MTSSPGSRAPDRARGVQPREIASGRLAGALQNVAAMMRSLLLPLALVLPSVAEASLCNLEPATLDVPVNCPAVVYNQATSALPQITVERGGQPVAVQPAVKRTTRVQVAVDYSDLCHGETVHETRAEEYDIVELELPGVQVGDVLLFDSSGQRGVVTDAATQCRTAPEWGPWCNSSGYVDCGPLPEDDDGGGCNAGGGASGGLALAIAALLARLTRGRSARHRARPLRA